MTALRRVGSLLRPATMSLIALVPLAVSVLTVASEVMAAVKAGLALSVAATAAWYACRLAVVGRNR